MTTRRALDLSAYRAPGPLAKLPPRAPWWRLAWHWRTLLKLRTRYSLAEFGAIVRVRRDGWHDIARARPFTDEEIDRHLPPSLRKGAA